MTISEQIKGIGPYPRKLSWRSKKENSWYQCSPNYFSNDVDKDLNINILII